jgi:hypothetical protein
MDFMTDYLSTHILEVHSGVEVRFFPKSFGAGLNSKYARR